MRMQDSAVKQCAQYLVGVFGAAAAFSALYGPVSGIPSSQLALAFVPLTLIALLVGGAKIPDRLPMALVISTALIGIFVLSKASPEQFTFLLDRTKWHLRDERYVEAKLLTFLISFVPQLLVLCMIGCARDVRKACVGALFSLAVLAGLACLRVLIVDGAGLIRTDYMDAFNTLLAPGFSLVSYGILLTVGGVAALYFRHGWILTGLALFVVALLSRRADTFALVFLVAAIAIYLWVAGRSRSGLKHLYSLALGAALIVPLHNGHNVAYFEATQQAYELRKNLVEEALNIEIEEVEAASKSNDDVASKESVENVSVLRHDPFFGYGLGNYQKITGGSFEYPHNILLEIFLELGVMPAALFLFVAFWPVGLSAFQAFRGRIDYTTMYLAAGSTAAIAISLKAGELGELGRLAFLSGLTLFAASLPQREQDPVGEALIPQEMPAN